MKKAIIFDFDNTIVSSIKYWKRVIDKETAKKYKVKVDPNFAVIRHGYSNIDTAKLFLDMHKGLSTNYKEIVDFWYKY